MKIVSESRIISKGSPYTVNKNGNIFIAILPNWSIEYQMWTEPKAKWERSDLARDLFLAASHFSSHAVCNQTVSKCRSNKAINFFWLLYWLILVLEISADFEVSEELSQEK